MSQQSNPYTSYKPPQSTKSTSYSFSTPPVSETDPNKLQSSLENPTSPSKPRRKKSSSSSKSFSPPPVSETDPDKQVSSLETPSEPSQPKSSPGKEKDDGFSAMQVLQTPPPSSSFNEGTRTDLTPPIVLSTQPVRKESSYRTPDGTFSVFEDTRSEYQKTKDAIRTKLFTQSDTASLTPKEIAFFPVVG